MRLTVIALLIAAGSGLAAPAAAQRRGEQADAFEGVRSGALRPLGEIIARTNQRIDGRYMGSDFDPDSRTYRLKYLRGSSVINVDVDAASGRIIGQSGN